MTFIKVRIYDHSQPEEHDIFLNTAQIISIEQVMEGYCLITLANRETVRVENKIDEIIKMAQSA
jgi:hypothetical protein